MLFFTDLCFEKILAKWSSIHKIYPATKLLITPQPVRAVGVLFSPMVSGWEGGGKNFVRPF